MQKALDAWEDKTPLTDSLIELGECILKNNIFEHNTSFYKQLRGTAIGTKMALPYAIIFMGDFEEKLLQDFDKKSLTWWYIDDIFRLWQHDRKNMKRFIRIYQLLQYHKKIYCYWIMGGDFLDVSVRKKITNFSLICISNQQTRINIYILPVTYITQKNPYFTIRHYTYTEFIQKTHLSINVVMG